MAGKTGPNDPGGRVPRDKVRELRRRLWAGAKRARGRRFHALYDQIHRSDVLWEAWERVRRNRGAAGIDSQSIRDVFLSASSAIVADLNPVLRGWGNYFRTGNAARRFNQLDSYVWRRLRALRVQRKGRHLRAGEADRWTRDYFHNLGLHRLRGTVRYPEQPFWQQETA
jgi:hypothetical protein